VTDPFDFWGLLLSAVGLMLVFEGLMPLISPRQWRAVFEQAAKLADGQLRFLGLLALLIGAALLVFSLP
jgi:uncharacterized protein YjeT (DUF2065 family)